MTAAGSLGAVMDLDEAIAVQLVDVATAPPALLTVIGREGVAL